MPTKMTPQQQLAKQALQQLAVIGGAMTRDEDITYEGHKFVFPTQYQGDLKGMAQFVNRYVESQEEEILVDRTFDYRPYDGAMAVYHCLKEYFGYAQSTARQGMFGPVPPSEVNIDLGWENGQKVTATVPWGDLILPGIKDARLTTTEQRVPHKGSCFRLVARCRRADKAIIDGFFQMVDKRLSEHSIYRGKAIDGGMNFFDVERIDPDQFVYDELAWAQAETHILSPMAHADVLAKKGLALKRVVLLEGPYGTGKSGLGRTAAKVAEAHGWTAITCRPGIDDPFQVMQTARLYQPAMVFVEDVDTFSANLDPEYVTKLLDQFDGFGTKDLRMLLVLTTNHANRIHKGMLRPGRLDAVIHIGNMDRAGVEKLTKIVIGDALEGEIDYDKVFLATDGFTPAYVREALERAVRYTIARTGEVGNINTDDLVNACHSLRTQLELQNNATDRRVDVPPLDQQFRNLIKEQIESESMTIRDTVDERIESRINGATILKPSGDLFGSIATN